MIKSLTIGAALVGGLLLGQTAHADTLVEAHADCSQIVVHVSGVQDGDTVMVGEGGQPPFGVTIGDGAPWQFAVDEQAGTVDTTLPVGVYESTHDFTAIVDLVNHEHPFGVRLFSQDVTCTPPASVVVEPAPVVVVAEPVVPAASQLIEASLWADVALSPPW